MNRQIKTNEIYYATDEEGKVKVWYRKYMLDGQNTYHQAWTWMHVNTGYKTCMGADTHIGYKGGW